VLLIAGFWMFALQRGPGVASVGVPVERFEAPREETLPDPGPAEAAPAAPEPAAPAEQPAAPADSAESAAANAVAG
jgi:hypothetical protein